MCVYVTYVHTNGPTFKKSIVDIFIDYIEAVFINLILSKEDVISTYSKRELELLW